MKSGQKVLPLGIALFLVIGAVISNITLKDRDSRESTGVLGGPADTYALPSQILEEATLPGVAKAAVVSEDKTDQSPITDSLSTATLLSTSRVSLVSESAAPSPNHVDPRGDSSPGEVLPRLSRYFIQPTSGANWGILHDNNAVDIANVCGTAIVAAADGIVTSGDGGGNWNAGYGNYVTIEHPNGTKTKYAHMNKVGVSTGDDVRQGQGIGTIGNTGLVRGVTGCHLHFEVYGAANPFARK